MSSASSERRSVPAIENGCMVGTWLSSSASSAPSLPTGKPTRRVREAERVPELVHLGRAAVEVGARPVDDQEHVVDHRVAPSTIVVARAEAVDRGGGEAERAQRVAGLVEDHLLLAVAGQVAPGGLVVVLGEVDRVAAPSTALVSVPHGSLAVATLFHVAVASAISPETSVGPLSIVSGIGRCSQCDGGPCVLRQVLVGARPGAARAQRGSSEREPERAGSTGAPRSRCRGRSSARPDRRGRGTAGSGARARTAGPARSRSGCGAAADHLDDEAVREPALEHALDLEARARERRARPPSTTREPRETTTAIRCARFAASALESGNSGAGADRAAGAVVVRSSPPQPAIASATSAASPAARREARGVTARLYAARASDRPSFRRACRSALTWRDASRAGASRTSGGRTARR